MMIKELLGSIENKSHKVGIVGLGYVGFPLLLRFAEEGFFVMGFDVDESKVDSLNNCKSYIKHFGDEAVEGVKEYFSATTDFSKIQDVDSIIICVPTPLSANRDPDLSFVTGTLDSIESYIRKGQLISLESTTYPGTTNEIIAKRITEKGFKVGDDIFIVYSPEREDPGNLNFSTKTIPKVVGGVTKDCLTLGAMLYSAVIDQVVEVSSTQAAEMTKLLENIHRAVNIGLVNELKMVVEKMGLNIHEIIDAAATKPFGFVPYKPGPGLGGHCIPIDPFYLTWKAKEFGIHTKFIELAGEVNSYMPEYVVNKIQDVLNQAGKPINNSRLLLLGVAYKKNVDDMRESPSFAILEKLQELGGKVCYSDPHIPKIPKLRNYTFDLESVTLSESAIKSYDCVVLLTDHDDFDYELIKKHSKVIVDTRGVYRYHNGNIFSA